MTNLTFQMPHIPQTVVIYGVGGTGSRIVPPVAQLMSKMPTMINPELILVDFDEVEVKNLDRQNFAGSDVGKNKATALASRYAKAYTTKITPITVAAGGKEYAEAVQMFGVHDRLSGPALHIIAVDSAKARREILKSVLQAQAHSQHSSVVVDCGNEDIFGQVSYFTTGRASMEVGMEMETVHNWYQGVIPGEIIISDLPFDVDFYANMQEGVSTRSCADLDQTLAINNMMASVAVAMIQNILMGKPMNYFRINIDLFNGVSHDAIQVPDLVRRIKALGETIDHNTGGSDARTMARNVVCQSSTFSTQMRELFGELDSEMLTENPVRYNTSKIIRESLGMAPFVPSLLLKDRFPEQYRDEWVALWSEGYKLPEIPERDRQVYEELMAVYKELQDECDRLNNEAAQIAVPVPAMAEGEDDGDEPAEGDDD